MTVLARPRRSAPFALAKDAPIPAASGRPANPFAPRS